MVRNAKFFNTFFFRTSRARFTLAVESELLAPFCNVCDQQQQQQRANER